MSVFDDFQSLRESPHHLQMLVVFIVTSFIAIFATTLILGTVLVNYMISQTTMREVVVSQQFLNSVVQVEDIGEISQSDKKLDETPAISKFFNHVSNLPDVFRANVYAPSGEIVWSSDPEMVGLTFDNNEELSLALNGKMSPELGIVGRNEKEEHIGLPDGVLEFIEYYIPLWSADRSHIVGAVEVYKAPQDLLQSIHHLTRLSWIGASVAGAVLFSALILVVGYSSRILHRQEQRLIETEKMAVVGEMASAVAHGLRNPLAAIRSCAELISEDPQSKDSHDIATDIVDQVDRLEGWIRSFLVRNRSEEKPEDYSRIDQVIARCIENFKPQIEKRKIKLQLDAPTTVVAATGPAAELEQLLNSIISNALEAMEYGGTLSISWASMTDGQVSVQIKDTGPGIPKESLPYIFEPFRSSKATGLGVGLALGRRIAERLGGQLKLQNREPVGVEVTLSLPSAS